MLKSMTGFGTAAGLVDSVEYVIEVKSVNNRYLKVSTRLPDSLHSLEPQIETVLKKHIQRGSVFLAVKMKIADENAASSVNFAALESYMTQIHKLEWASDNNRMRLDLATLLQLPGVCTPPSLEELAEKTSGGLLKLIEQAVKEMVEMRVTEGKAVREDLVKNASVIRDNLNVIAGRVDDVLKLYHERLKNRVDELIAHSKVSINEESLAREVALFAERSDIAEEVSRLGTHLDEFEKVCDSKEPVGRKLDFMSQEMLREANTIGSKSSDADIARLVVDIKTAIDRIKEQAANIE